MKEEATELYRKHRPKRFSDLVGQDEVVKILEEKVRTNTVPHALLFSGGSGTGKTTTARILRRALKCGNADYREFDVGDNRGIDTARQIKQTLGLAPMSGKCRIIVLDEIHSSTREFQSAMIKMLEDCPSHIYFILATTEPEGLLPTIRTRCTHLAFKPVHHSEMATLLTGVLAKEQKTAEKQVLEKIVEVSDGSARKALVLLEKVLVLTTVDEQLNAIESEDVKKKSESIAKLILTKNPWKKIADCLKELKSEEPERIRRMILGYANAIVLNTGNKRAYFILDAFEDNLYSSGHPGLTRRCFYVTQKTD